MKRTFFSLFGLLMCTLAFAQWSTNASKVYYNGGKVGIGNNNPQAILEIRGGSATYSDFAEYSGNIDNNILPNGKPPSLIIYENISGSVIPATGGQVTYRGGLSFGLGGPGIYSVNPNPAGSTYYGEIRFHTTYWNGSSYSNADRMVVKMNGNIGIGTPNPGDKLEVNGTIRSKKVKVEASGWPDYVFADNYQLPTLGEIESFIKTNGHLPEVPSATEVETNGLDLGDMEAKLLKKVEELTLYLIDQNKELNNKDQRIQNLETENSELKIRLARIEKIIGKPLKN